MVILEWQSWLLCSGNPGYTDVAFLIALHTAIAASAPKYRNVWQLSNPKCCAHRKTAAVHRAQVRQIHALYSPVGKFRDTLLYSEFDCCNHHHHHHYPFQAMLQQWTAAAKAASDQILYISTPINQSVLLFICSYLRKNQAMMQPIRDAVLRRTLEEANVL